MYKLIVATGLFSFPAFAFAFVFGIEDVLDLFVDYISEIIPILVGLAIVVFFWGIIKFIFYADDERTKAEGKQLMVWGMVILFVMVSLWSIVGFLQESTGLDATGSLGSNPTIPTTLPLMAP